jgi:hypothetical protein
MTDTINLVSFQEAVAAKVAACNSTVLDRVVDHFAEQEASRRVPLILEGLKQEEIVRKSLGKFKPENMYDDGGNVVSTYWTQQTLQGKKKAEETLKKWQDALGLAITESNYQPLEKLVKSGEQPSGQDARSPCNDGERQAVGGCRSHPCKRCGPCQSHPPELARRPRGLSALSANSGARQYQGDPDLCADRCRSARHGGKPSPRSVAGSVTLFMVKCG